MIAESTSDSTKKWAFTTFVEINPQKLLERSSNQKDIDRIARIFSGFSIGPGESIRVDPWFVPMAEAENKIIARDNIRIGKYRIKIFGYSPDGERVLETKPVEYPLSKQNLLQAFSGSESVLYLNVEKHIDNAISNTRR